MKKSIKYAGIAAATLLTVAPVAAPVVSNATTVQAADATDTQAQTTAAVQTAADTYTSGLKQSTTVSDDDLTTMVNSVKNISDGALTYTWSGYADTPFFTLNSSNGSNISTLATNKADVQLSKISITDATGAHTINSAEDFALLDTNSIKSISYVVTIPTYTPDTTAIDLTTPSVSKTVTYSLKDAAENTTNKVGNVTTDSSMNVDYGSSIKNTQYSSTATVAAKDADGNAIKSFTVAPTANYYTTQFNAITGDSAVNTDANYIDQTKNTFVKEGTLYQPVTINVTGDLADLLAAYKADTTGDYTFNLNGSDLKTQVANGTAKYTATAASGTGDSAVAATGTITYVRAINVGSEGASQWTTTDESGVVTTKSDTNYYTLHNDNNDLISNRALAKNTAWQYDAVRTNANGDKQYRVSTHEWIPAESVTVNDDNNGGSTADGALTVTDLATKKVVNLSTPGTVYFLYNKEGKVSDVRSLAGGSSWLVDKTATDAAGNTYYGVSTDEFVKAGEGVSLAD